MKEKTSFNFALRWEEELNRTARARNVRRQQKTTRIMLGLLLLGLLFSPWVWEYKLRYDASKLEGQIIAMGTVDQEVQKRDALLAQVKSQEQISDLVAQNAHDPGTILAQLGQFLPSGTAVTSFSLQADNSFTVEVAVPTPVDVARLWVGLEESGLYEGVNIQTVSLEDKTQTLSLNLKLKL